MKRTITFCSSNSLTPVKKERPGVSPSEFAIRNIMNYSRALEVLKTEKGGTVNLIMN
jgi:hypothetical protein